MFWTAQRLRSRSDGHQFRRHCRDVATLHDSEVLLMIAYSPIVTAVRVCLSFLQLGSSQAARAVSHDVTACRPGAGRVRPRLGRGLSHHPRCGAPGY